MTRKVKTKAALTDRQKGVSVSKSLVGSQTLLRGLDVLEAVASGATKLPALTDMLELNRSTVHRLAASLVERRYLSFSPRIGYALGPKLLEVGFQASVQMNLPRIAREYIEALAARTGDTVHLGILDGTRALYLDKIPGRRRVEISSRIGERQPLHFTGLGKALLLDETEDRLRQFYHAEYGSQQQHKASLNTWLRRMRAYAKLGYAFDLEENEDCIRCVAAPVRDATGEIKAAISVSSAAQYMDDKRMGELAEEVRSTAYLISRDLGWNGSLTSDGNAPLQPAGPLSLAVS
ncbi:MAG TPA: IclR family transcriptional regulator [Rhizomicrobium sp.]|jgi:DNA-binding IclR family transcriptional regulator|nr:IclR family transcriptional regulator [Rhizomicrobium sp.]